MVVKTILHFDTSENSSQKLDFAKIYLIKDVSSSTKVFVILREVILFTAKAATKCQARYNSLSQLLPWILHLIIKYRSYKVGYTFAKYAYIGKIGVSFQIEHGYLQCRHTFAK